MKILSTETWVSLFLCYMHEQDHAHNGIHIFGVYSPSVQRTDVCYFYQRKHLQQLFLSYCLSQMF